MARFVDSIG